MADIQSASQDDAPNHADEQAIRQQVVSQIAQGLMKLAGEQEMSLALDTPVENDTVDAATPSTQGMAPWIDSSECTACDECIKLNSKLFVYNDSKQAVIQDPKAGPYRDLVKAAEKCTAQVIHPGLPLDPNEKDLDKWMARGEKYN